MKIVFYIQYKLYKYYIILFSLINIPAIYQELINDTLWNILDKYIIAYLDNTLIYLNKIFEDHVIKIKEVLR